ncbi:MAG: hypothetical protein HQL12_05025 [Candidatus Omnitrophica bacterium]|nr:hypothetical protein [Candidatus Omnitrophota bacterium]
MNNVILKEVKPRLSAAVWTLDTKEYQPYVVVDENLEGTFRLERETNTLYDKKGKRINDYKGQQRPTVAPVKDLMRKFRADHPDLEIAGITSNENIFYNKPIVTVIRDRNGRYRVYHALGEKVDEGRNYPMYVIDVQGSAAIEINVRFQMDADQKYAKVFVNGKKKEIRWATTLQLMVNDAKFTPPDKDNGLAYFYDDLKHLFVLPTIEMKGYMSRGPAFMADQLLSQPELINKHFADPHAKLQFQLTYSKTDKDGKKLTVPVSREEAELLLEKSGYRKGEDYSFIKAPHAKEMILIRLKENGYPFHIIAQTKSHQIKEIAMRGDGDGRGTKGATIREAAKWLIKEGAIRAGIIDQGKTVYLNVKGKTYVEQQTDKDSGVHKAASIIIYAKKKGRLSKN